MKITKGDVSADLSTHSNCVARSVLKGERESVGQ